MTVEAALDYLRAQSFGAMDDELVSTFVRTGQEMVDFVEAHSDVRFEVAAGFPDYKPELPGGRPSGGRSLSPLPYDISRLGSWHDRITAFPADYSNVGFDAETRARLHADIDNTADTAAGNLCVAGTALIAGLLKGLLDAGVAPATGCRGVELIGDHGDSGRGGVAGVRVDAGGTSRRVRARRGVILANGGFEWDTTLVEAFLRGRCGRGVTAAQHRRRAAHGDGARRRPGQHGRGVVGSDRPNSRRHHRRPTAQPQRATGAHPAAQHHRQPVRAAVCQRGV